MKRTYKYLTLTGLIAVWCLFMAIPAMAQHRGGGGGGGSSGGGHSGGGGGFSGGGRSSGFSGGSPSVGISPRQGSFAPRSSVSAQRGSIAPRSGYMQGQRGYTRSNSISAAGVAAHRGYVPGSLGGGVYGHGGSYGNYNWGGHGGYFYYGGFYGSLYYPWLGLGFGFLPYGYYSFYWGGYPYYYWDGFYYQYDNDQYTVVEPPVGAAINKLPSGAQSIVIDGQQYYEKNGVYYQAITKDDGTVVYQIAGKDGQLNTGASGASAVTPHEGDIVTKLPSDCRKVKLNGTTFYVSADGIYYQETRDSNNKKVYKVVGLDSDSPDKQ